MVYALKKSHNVLDLLSFAVSFNYLEYIMKITGTETVEVNSSDKILSIRKLVTTSVFASDAW